MNFSILTAFFESLRASKSVPEKTTKTKSFMKKVRAEYPDQLFPMLRLTVPKLDRDRAAYRIKETKISRLLIRMLDLPQGGDRNLLSKSVSSKSSCDLGDVIYSVIRKYLSNQKTSLTVDKLNDYLDQIANRPNDNDLDDLMLEIYRKLAAKDIKWFVQIVLKDLRLGISDTNILSCFHEDGANFYNSNNNLKKVCETLADPKTKLHELEIGVFEPFRPMLCKRCDSSNFNKSFPDGEKFFIENKFDGERFQIHMENGKFKYFSRNGFDFTNSYGSSYSEGMFTPLLREVFRLDVTKLILDGEMMLWNTHTKKFGSKGMNLDVKKLSKGKYKPCFCVYDILLLNDQVLTNQPLEKRIKLIRSVIENPKPGVLLMSDYREVSSRQEIVDALNISVDNNEEGIVVKDPNSIYKCSDRKSGWFKIKMEYFDDVVHDLDLLMMGGCFGPNSKINSFFVGISSGVDTYFSMGKIGSGLNDEQLDLLTEKLQKDGSKFDQFGSKSKGKLHFGRETPDLYLEPEKSLILQIRATELIRTTSDFVKTPYTLRFPRVLKIRDDKPANECLSMNELLELTRQNKAVIKLNKRHIELLEITPKTSRAKIFKLEVANKLEHSKFIGNVLKEKKIHVFSGTEDWAKDDIYNSIKNYGGVPSYRLDPNVDIVLTGKVDKNVESLMGKIHKFDIIHCKWFRRVLDSRELLNYEADEIFACGYNYESDLGDDFDMFGDSFQEGATEDSMKRVFQFMKFKKNSLNLNGAIQF